jgi:hypothetical protein
MTCSKLDSTGNCPVACASGGWGAVGSNAMAWLRNMVMTVVMCLCWCCGCC